jgi:hypothetical protein
LATGTSIHDWNPGLLHGELSLGTVVRSLPAYPPEAIPRIIRFFENPASPWALPGAIHLWRHDALHAVLGRGLEPEDEAFVLGFTMGCSDGKRNAMTRLLGVAVAVRSPLAGPRARAIRLRDWQVSLFRWVSSHLYGPPNRFTRQDLVAFDLGLSLGERNPVRNLEDVPFETMGDMPVARVRADLGIDVGQLESVYRAEAAMLASPVSRRLDVAPDGPDMSFLGEAGD